MKIEIATKHILWSIAIVFFLTLFFSKNWIVEKIYQRSNFVRKWHQDIECIVTVSEITPERMNLFFPEWHENISGFFSGAFFSTNNTVYFPKSWKWKKRLEYILKTRNWEYTYAT